MRVVDINDEIGGIFDIELMSHCQYNVIANSSFSWWGAWLNENPDKIIAAPRYWVSDGREAYIVPDNWITLESKESSLGFIFQTSRDGGLSCRIPHRASRKMVIFSIDLLPVFRDKGLCEFPAFFGGIHAGQMCEGFF